jgi:hypothetical protein
MKYELVIVSNKRISFSPIDLTYFRYNFICESLRNKWTIPPVTVLGKSYKAADFVLWMQRAPVISEKAKDALSDICGDLVEFLPFHAIKGKSYFVLNVLNMKDSEVIFKKSPNSVIFVTEEFGDILIDKSLTGAVLADPDDDIDRKMLRGESVNAYPGLLG